MTYGSDFSIDEKREVEVLRSDPADIRLRGIKTKVLADLVAVVR